MATAETEPNGGASTDVLNFSTTSKTTQSDPVPDWRRRRVATLARCRRASRAPPRAAAFPARCTGRPARQSEAPRARSAWRLPEPGAKGRQRDARSAFDGGGGPRRPLAPAASSCRLRERQLRVSAAAATTAGERAQCRALSSCPQGIRLRGRIPASLRSQDPCSALRRRTSPSIPARRAGRPARRSEAPRARSA
jgi:hypothetical protein